MKNNTKIIESIFQIQVGDIVQILKDDKWVDLGTIKDKRQAQIEFGVNGFLVMNKPIRIVRNK